MDKLVHTLGLKARVFGLHGSTTEVNGSNMMLLRGDWRAALHIATSRSTTCRTAIAATHQSHIMIAMTTLSRYLCVLQTSAPVATSSVAPDITPNV